MKHFIIIILTCISFLAEAQYENIVGKWKFDGVEDSAKLDEKGKQGLEMFFGSMTVTIQDNGLYQLFMMGKSENGFWEFTPKDSGEIILNTENGEIFQTPFSFISTDRIKLSLNTMVYIMKRVPMDNEITLKDIKSLPESISLDKKTIAQKWYYVESIDSTKKQEIVDAGNSMLQGAYLDLKSNGQFDQDVILLKVKGKWELAHDGKALVTKSEGMSKIWFFESFDGSNLMMINPINNKRILYSNVQSKD